MRDIDRFAAEHLPALGVAEVEHNLILTLIAQAVASKDPLLRHWSLGVPGACAVQNPGWPLVLGVLGRLECAGLAEALRDLEVPGFLGPEASAEGLAVALRGQGRRPLQLGAQQIYALERTEIAPSVQGASRVATEADEARVVDWTLAFHQEAVPEDPPPDSGSMVRNLRAGEVLLWLVKEEPLAMAKTARRTANVGVINAVYTVPEYRGQGYGGAVTAAVAGRIFAEGKAQACLHADLANPASNRCYRKIGFQPVARFAYYRMSPTQ